MTVISWAWPASTIVRIIDGDSFIAEVHRDLGFHGTATFLQKMRLNRINCPPATSDKGRAATVQSGVLMIGQVVSIETTGAYKFGDEWMAEVTLLDGRNVSDALVAAGVAVYWDGNGPRPGG
jgi:endonuclease YncB( thermonuclease family)